MNTVRTVSDTKRAFYNIHTRPINAIYRRVVEELMVEMHLLSVNVDFRYDPIYALGVVTAFERFTQGYLPAPDQPSIFNALCGSLGANPQQYQQDANRLRQVMTGLSLEDLTAWFQQTQIPPGVEDVQGQLQAIAENSRFKYSRLFGIGLFSILELVSPDTAKEELQATLILNQLSEALHLPGDKLQKDLELYRSNLEKISQARIVLEDVLQAERKKREQREQAKEAVATPPDAALP
ncbi:inositol phosphatase [Neosynechococcus sphagnicola sy1]|uniref:Protein Thf1 n=1 Tax=Neosynechococcus sphagnicola sy1 TaxID=1497020 RepID=A0A098TKE6_9CYAN|nr:photosystem II biogenesis protein Psp29 [Neosynechococcus sphagnicola]KGF72322.1 inositol phosphatase [Neosynechococcus sphagnicola sy1]